MKNRYSTKTDHQGRSYICDRKIINDPLKCGALRDSQIVHRLNRLECIGETLSELGKKLDRRNKQIDKLKAINEKLVVALENIKKIEDAWDNCIPECDVCASVQEIAEQALSEAGEISEETK